MTSADPSVSPGRSAWLRPGLLAAGLVLAVLIVLALSERSTGFTVDEGSYAIQAEALDGGSWSIAWPFRSVDPDGAHFPYHGGTVGDTDEFAYVSHPAWPALLSSVRSIGGEEVGLRLLSMASVVASAVIGFHLARALNGSQAAPWGFLVVLATPVLANGFMTWAHASSTALGGLAVLGGVRLVQGGPVRGWTAAVAVALAVGTLLRSEGLLLAGVVATALVIHGLASRGPHRRPLVVAGLVAGAATGSAFVLERVWRARIVGDGVSSGVTDRTGGSSSSWIEGRFRGMGASVFDGSLTSGGVGLLSALALVAVLAAAVSVLRRDFVVRPSVALAVAVVASVGRIVAGPDDPVPGLLTAAPLLVLAVIPVVRLASRLSSRATTWAREPIAFVAVCVGGFAATVLATQYDDGGGLQWGGRYLSPLLVPMAGLVATALLHEQLRQRAARLGVIGLVATSALGSLLITDEVRRFNADAMAEVDQVGASVVLTAGDQIGRLDWRSWPERQWIAANDDLDAAVGALRQADVGLLAAVLVPAGDLRDAGAVVPSRRDGDSVFLVDLDVENRPAAPAPAQEANMRSQVVAPG